MQTDKFICYEIYAVQKNFFAIDCIRTDTNLNFWILVKYENNDTPATFKVVETSKEDRQVFSRLSQK